MNRTRLSHYQINQDFKESVICVSIAHIDLSVGLESGSTIDGIELKKGDRVLIVGQSNPVENGIYYASELGAAVRSRDFVDGLKVGGCILFVEEGVEHANTGWNCISNRGTDVVGTHPLYFKRFTGQSDWNQEDSSEIDYIENKPKWVEESFIINDTNISEGYIELQHKPTFTSVTLNGLKESHNFYNISDNKLNFIDINDIIVGDELNINYSYNTI